jgi:hypothetical protein
VDIPFRHYCIHLLAIADIGAKTYGFLRGWFSVRVFIKQSDIIPQGHGNLLVSGVAVDGEECGSSRTWDKSANDTQARSVRFLISSSHKYHDQI